MNIFLLPETEIVVMDQQQLHCHLKLTYLDCSTLCSSSLLDRAGLKRMSIDQFY